MRNIGQKWLKSLRNLVGVKLLGPIALLTSQKEMMSETSIESLRVIKNKSIFNGDRKPKKRIFSKKKCNKGLNI